VEVAPQTDKLILIKQTDPYGFSLSSSAQVSALFLEAKLKEMCKTQGKQTARLHPSTKKPTEIYQYQLKHSGGMCYLYENMSDNLTLEETLKFKMNGLEIVGGGRDEDSQVQIKIKPFESKFVQLKALVGNWKIQTGVGYAIY